MMNLKLFLIFFIIDSFGRFFSNKYTGGFTKSPGKKDGLGKLTLANGETVPLMCYEGEFSRYVARDIGLKFGHEVLDDLCSMDTSHGS